MLELDLGQSWFTYSVFRSFNKHRERIQKFKEMWNLKYIYKKELDAACFAPNTACFHSKYLANRTISDSTSKVKAYEMSIDHKCDEYERKLASMV